MTAFLRTLRPLLLRLVLATGVIACAAPDDQQPIATDDPSASPYLFVWTTDADSTDLNTLAVLDARAASDRYGEVLTTLAVPTNGRTRGHHTEHRMPEGGVLFANDFGTGKSYLLDLRDPLRPALADSFTAAGELTAPHSFERLPNGNVLATFQTRGPGNTATGGLAELDSLGRTVRTASAQVDSLYIRPYSLAVAPVIDRVITGSADMRGGGDSHVVQIWRLSDLTLLHTLTLPEAWGAAAEPRVLSDGRTVLVSTFGCALLRLSAIESDAPTVERVHQFTGANCALPVVAGNVWVQTVPDDNALVALDVRDPAAPREVSRLTLGAGQWPHWISLEPNTRRIVITGYRATRFRVIMATLDSATGTLALDTRFGGDSAGPGVSFNRPEWPHGATGPGDPHGAVFSRPTP